VTISISVSERSILLKKSSPQPGEIVRLLVQPFMRGTVEEIREGQYELEAVVAGKKQNVIVGLANIKRVKGEPQLEHAN
jgi:hypothetical protein